MNVFSTHRCVLGEGPVWHPERQSLFWVDIHEYCVFEKAWNSDSTTYDNCWVFPYKPSALFCSSLNPAVVYVLTSAGLMSLDTDSGTARKEISLNLPKNFRTNDAGVSPDGCLWFGTMEEKPTLSNGSIFKITPSGIIYKVLEGIGIPNTFCWNPENNKFYLSDSLQQQMRSYEYCDGNLSKHGILFIDLSTEDATPDGGAMDQEGNLWNAQWDGSRVVCYRPDGSLKQVVVLDALRPTSCCFGGPENKHLFITTASEGLTDAQINKYPHSGYVVCIEIADSLGLIPPCFDLLKE